MSLQFEIFIEKKAIFLLFLFLWCKHIRGVLVVALHWRSLWKLFGPVFLFFGALLMSASISLGDIGPFKLSDLDLTLVRGIYWDSCPFLLDFSDFLKVWTNDSLDFHGIWYFALLFSDFVHLDILSVPFSEFGKGLIYLVFQETNKLIDCVIIFISILLISTPSLIFEHGWSSIFVVGWSILWAYAQ